MTQEQSYLFAVNEIEIVYRTKVPREDRLKIQSSQSAYDILYQSWDMNKFSVIEQFRVILLDSGNTCLGISTLSTGGINSCFIDPRLLFALALKAKATTLIVAHNHPSGNLTPSNADLLITQKIVNGGHILGLCVQDHLILGEGNYLSMADEGIFPSPSI